MCGTDYENKYKNAKKLDKAGNVYITVRFGEVYLPVKAHPIDLPEQCETRSEILRLNLTNWVLNDIDEVAAIAGPVCLNHEALLYWNGAEGSWKFYDEPFSYPDENLSDRKEEKVEDLRIKLADAGLLFEPHLDASGNIGDEEDHAVYDCKTLKKFADDDEPEDELEEEDGEIAGEDVDLVTYVKQIVSIVGKARIQHKKIPYTEIGRKVFDMVSMTANDTELGKIFYKLSQELY